MKNLTSELRYYNLSDGGKVAYRCTEGSKPGVLFCAGFNSSMEGNKALYLESVCRQQGWQFTRFDYRGHGESSGDFSQCHVTHWYDDARAMLEKICTGPQIIVGSSMGGWIATLLAATRPERVAALITIAAAPDFTEELIWKPLDSVTQRRLQNGGVWAMPNHYDNGEPFAVSMALIDSGREHLVLDKPLNINCPTRLLHGTGDAEVPYSLSDRLLHQLGTSDARLILVKGADHRFSQPEQLTLIANTLLELRARLP